MQSQVRDHDNQHEVGTECLHLLTGLVHAWRTQQDVQRSRNHPRVRPPRFQEQGVVKAALFSQTGPDIIPAVVVTGRDDAVKRQLSFPDNTPKDNGSHQISDSLHYDYGPSILALWAPQEDETLPCVHKILSSVVSQLL